MLAAKVVQNCGIDVIALYFDTGFFPKKSRRRILKERMPLSTSEPRHAEKIAREIGVKLRVIDISELFVGVVTKPKFGYGKNINPCIDCKILMLSKAKELMSEYDAKFIFTGEVVGQRPMSQHKPSLNLIAKQSDLKGYLLRPLSAKILKPTIPEQEGWIDREKLYDFSGRSRQRQMQLAEELGIKNYAQPGGGCFLTEPHFAVRLHDLFEYTELEKITTTDLKLTMYGRHFRISPKVKIIVGRDESDNIVLEKFTKGRWVLQAIDFKGPLTLIIGNPHKAEIEQAARLTARYCDGKYESKVRIEAIKEGERLIHLVNPLTPESSESLRIGKDV